MNKLLITLLINILITCYNVCGQKMINVDNWIEFVNDLSTLAEDENQMEILYDELSYLSENPFNLNIVTADQLKVLPFLTDKQIESIIFHRDKYGKFLTVYELKNVSELDFKTIKLLLSFVYIDEIVVEKRLINVENLLKNGLNEVHLRYDRCFQRKKGYYQQPDSILEKYPNRRYVGEPFYNSFRYSYTFDDRIQGGLVAEKDAGEPFLNKHHKGYDYYSFHLFLKNINWLKSLAIGDYKVSFGQGLVISNTFTVSKNTIVTQAEKRQNGFWRHFSTDENNYFRGIATTFHIDNYELSVFYSKRKLDANLMDTDTFSSVKTDGLHRLPREREQMKTIPMSVFGANIRYTTPNVCVGMTTLTHSFSRYKLEPDLKPYNLFYFRGSDNTNISFDYLVKNRSLKFFGETALSRNKAMATLNALQFTPASYFSFLLLHRYYDRKYQSYFANAFSQNSTVQNEQGIYIGIQFTPFPFWKISGFADFFRFPWLKYGVDAPSSGKEYMAQVDYTQMENVSFYVRYKYKQREKNSSQASENRVLILPYTQQRLRFQMQYDNRSFLFKSSLEGSFYDGKSEKKSKGCIFSQGVGWKPAKIPVQWDLYAAWFYTDDYTNRLTSYEKNILYAFGMTQLFGEGVRLSTTFRWDISARLSLFTKLSCTRYFDKDEIGSGLEMIEGNIKSDIYSLIRWKF